jgi:outer membrane protein OmpA-like peptidoglycan-associated protein
MGLLKVLGLPDAPAGPAKPAPLSARPAAKGGPPKPLAHPDKGYKAISWATPSASVSASPVHVASIYFATRDSSVGSKEEALLRGLAKAYAPYARRGLFTRGEVGVQGSVVGHADPRRSHEPDNVALAQSRATIVARRLLRNLAGESGVIEGQFDISVEAAPVPTAVEDDAAIETDAYAPMRRADVFLVGGVMEEAPPPPGEPDPDEIPPPMEDLEHDWHRQFDAALERTDREEIRVMAIRMYSALGIGVSASGPRGGNVSAGGAVGAVWTAISLHIDLHHRARRSHLPSELKPTKPTWWDGLDAGSGASQGRNPKRNALNFKARRLMTWYLTTIRYGATYVDGPGGASKRAFDEIRKDKPDEAKMWVYARTVEQYLYMIQATVDLAQDVMKLAK